MVQWHSPTAGVSFSIWAVAVAQNTCMLQNSQNKMMIEPKVVEFFRRVCAKVCAKLVQLARSDCQPGDYSLPQDSSPLAGQDINALYKKNPYESQLKNTSLNL